MPSEILHKKIRVCHKLGSIVAENEESYTVEILLGEISQQILVSKEYAENNALD